VSSPILDMLACTGMQALQHTAPGVGFSLHSTGATTRSSSSGHIPGHRGVPFGNLLARDIGKQHSFPRIARHSSQHGQGHSWRRQALAAPQAVVAPARNDSSAGIEARDSGAAEAAYADFDWRDQWYPVAFVRDMPEGARTRNVPDITA
jgi:hypothetical protein